MNNTINQFTLADIYRTFYPRSAEYTFFLTTYRSLFRKDHMLSHKSHLNTFKRTKTHHMYLTVGIKLEINRKDISPKR